MKILHTADIHLHRDHPRRLEALRHILDKARQAEADVLVIAGDLFDDHHQAELLRGEMRTLFNNLPFIVLAIPGNHDEKAYTGDCFYGNDFVALTETPCSIWENQDWRLVGVPYQRGAFAPLRQVLAEAATPDKTNVLILHCTWALPHYTDQDYGPAGPQQRYLPVTPDLLTGLGYQYILAGHFHTTFRVNRLPCGASFVYPGSPVSVTAREQGPRSVNLVADGSCHQLSLSTWYHLTLEYTVRVDNQQEILTQLAGHLAEHSDSNCQLTLRLTGYSGGDERQFNHRLQQLVAGRTHTTIANHCRSVEKILADPLFVRFKQHLHQAESDVEQVRAVEKIMLDAFCQLAAEGLHAD